MKKLAVFFPGMGYTHDKRRLLSVVVRPRLAL